MFLARKYRGKGIGQQMLETALNFAKKAGYSKLFLYSSKDLMDSRKLYTKKMALWIFNLILMIIEQMYL
jgi:GNAT superfamily N-acetyltransferase